VAAPGQSGSKRKRKKLVDEEVQPTLADPSRSAHSGRLRKTPTKLQEAAAQAELKISLRGLRKSLSPGPNPNSGRSSHTPRSRKSAKRPDLCSPFAGPVADLSPGGYQMLGNPSSPNPTASSTN
jgi:hypothetical protein